MKGVIMSRVIYDSVKGLVEYADGDGFEIQGDVTLSSSPISTVSLINADATLVKGGVYTVSGTDGYNEVTMPLASSVPGATFIFRSLSVDAHYLTGSAEVAGTKVFAGQPGTGALANNGSKLTLPSVVGSSVVLVSDGKNFLVSAASGSFTISGT